MRRYIYSIILASMFFTGQAFGQARDNKEPNQIFYQANASYEQKDYAKALENYNRILGMGLESGALYYNIGNSFFKMGKMGYAILFYEKARRFIPQDSDLRANLTYARSLIADSEPMNSWKRVVTRFIRMPFRSMNINSLLILTSAIYLIVVSLLAAFILNPIIRH